MYESSRAGRGDKGEDEKVEKLNTKWMICMA